MGVLFDEVGVGSKFEPFHCISGVCSMTVRAVRFSNNRRLTTPKDVEHAGTADAASGLRGVPQLLDQGFEPDADHDPYGSQHQQEELLTGVCTAHQH
jgi:hypothetical protein